MKRTRIAAASATVVIWLVVGAASASTIEETIEQTLAFAPGDRLEVSNVNGDIDISVWDRDEIRIEARKRVKSSSGERAQAAFDDLQILITDTQHGVTVETDYPRRDEGRWGRRASAAVDYNIRVPKSADLDVGTVNGNIDLSGVVGDLELHTTNGGIDVEDAGGRVSARTTNGNLDVELREIARGADMVFRSTNGAITLSLPVTAEASLSARTTNGGIHTDFPITVRDSIGRNRLEGEINGGGGKIELRTTNGSIHIREL